MKISFSLYAVFDGPSLSSNKKNKLKNKGNES